MDVQKAIDSLQLSLIRDLGGAYRLPCPKAFLKVNLQGASRPLLFTARDKVCFRLDEDGLRIERLKTGVGCMHLTWKQVESLAVGEPETDSGLLFQG